MNKKKQEIDETSQKFEIAEELGLGDKIREVGWAGLTAKESGRIGGIMTSRKKKLIKKE
ncbi:small, acid-soluble spore protein, alpha/beta type [Tissierella creatinini]|nr:small, acid-soluble spore protein, alpha/beta type [Tissierella creatinini]TJX66687.1 small, acid-soluble spore protein, alpha/beta type [Soehngenia saccharolytica]